MHLNYSTSLPTDANASLSIQTLGAYAFSEVIILATVYFLTQYFFQQILPLITL